VQLSREEKKQRDALLARFGYEEERVDSNGDILLDDHEEGTSHINFEKNLNSAKIVEKDQQFREKSKQQHQQKVQRDKDLLKEQELQKEKAKRRTQKQEKRRL